VDSTEYPLTESDLPEGYTFDTDLHWLPYLDKHGLVKHALEARPMVLSTGGFYFVLTPCIPIWVRDAHTTIEAHPDVSDCDLAWHYVRVIVALSDPDRRQALAALAVGGFAALMALLPEMCARLGHTSDVRPTESN
jgi:hypothetical protein